jgi:hypothetical protein
MCLSALRVINFMNEKVTERMKDYFTGSAHLDIQMLEGIYASHFESVRSDLNGRLIIYTKQHILHKMLQLKEQNLLLPVPETIDYLGATEYGDFCSLLYRMVKGEETAVYHFVWQRMDDRYLLTRQFTVEQDLTYLN